MSNPHNKQVWYLVQSEHGTYKILGSSILVRGRSIILGPTTYYEVEQVRSDLLGCKEVMES